jgi:hypothetical protein
MKIALRAATHLDFSVLPSGVGSRYGQAVASYFTLAWFDRYLRGKQPGQSKLGVDARRRLTAERFDDSVDVHQLSGGTYDPTTGSNVGAMLAGLPVRDRLSFHFRSAWDLDGGRRICEEIRAGGCDRSAAATRRRRVCRRLVSVSLPSPPAGDRIARVSVKVGMAKPRRTRVLGKRVRIRVSGRPGRRVRVVIRVTTIRGRHLAERRSFRACA